MLQTIRDRSQGVIVGAIVFLISLTFALWGVESYISAGRRVIVAEAAGEEILLEDFQQALQRFRRQAETVLGDAFNPADWAGEEAKTRTLNQLIDDRILADLIEDARIHVSNAQVARQVHQIPAFHDDDGGFSRELYDQRVAALGYTQIGFEQQLRADMERAQLRSGVAASEFVMLEEAQRAAALREQKRDIGYAIIPASAVDDQVEISDADVEQYFTEHAENYRTTEKATLEYLEISASVLAASVPVDDNALHQYYDANQAAFTVPEERNVNHILIHVPAGADSGAEAAALAKAKDALARARAGESFEQLAQSLSDDVGSRTEGGETGFFPRGAMAPEFEEAAFALAPGEISEPIRTKFGYHIIKLKEVKAGGLEPFDEAREDVEAAYRAAEAQKVFFEQAEQFSNLVYEHPDSLAVAAEALGLEPRRTDALTQPEIAALFSDRVAAATFEPEVLLEGLNSEPVELPDGRLVAVRVLEHAPAVIPPLAEVKDEVTAALRAERQQRLTTALGEQLIERLRKQETVADTVEAAGFGWKQADGADRESNEVNRAVLREAFTTPVPDDEAVFTGIPIGTSDYAVIRVANVVTPPASELDSAEVDAIRVELMKERMAVTWREFVDAVRAANDVKIYSKNL